MSGQLVEFGLSIYQQNPSVFFVIVSSGIILLFALLMSNNLHRSETRVVFIVVPIALATYMLSIHLENVEHDFFQNLSTEFIGGLLALILFAEWITSNEYTFPIVAVLIFGVAGVFMWQASLTDDGFYINLSTELLGALITTAVIRREWLWSKRDVRDETPKERHARFESKRQAVERETARRLCQLHITLRGKTLQEIEHRQQILSESVDIAYEGKIAKRSGELQRIIYSNCRDTKIYPASREHVMVILDGHEHAIEKTVLRLSETFEVQDSQDQLSQLGSERSQMRVKVKTPAQSFEQELHGMMDMFVARWHESMQTMERPSEDFVNGYAQAVEYVCQDLRATLESV